jgi:hypothetical protein
MTKIAGSGSGFISQRHGSADPDPPQNVMDPQHCFNGLRVQQKNVCRRKNRARGDFYTLGRIIEGSYRSLNNLLER